MKLYFMHITSSLAWISIKHIGSKIIKHNQSDENSFSSINVFINEHCIKSRFVQEYCWRCTFCKIFEYHHQFKMMQTSHHTLKQQNTQSRKRWKIQVFTPGHRAILEQNPALNTCAINSGTLYHIRMRGCCL